MKEEPSFRGPVIGFVRELFGFEDELLVGARRRAEEAGLPPIEVAPEDGALLATLVRTLDPRLVVEIGTLFGYSAIWMGRALDPAGRLLTIERDPEHARVARLNLEEAGLADRVTVLEGEAREVLGGIPGPVDLVFIDADKVSYPAYLAWARDHLRPGGLMAADNVLWRGEVIEPLDEEGRALRRFLEDLTGDPAWRAALVPTLEGMALGVRT